MNSRDRESPDEQGAGSILRRNLSRRKFLQLGLVAGSGLLASCAPAAEQKPAAGAPAAPTQAAAKPAAAATAAPAAAAAPAAGAPKRGGTLKLAVPSAARRLDPAITGSNDEYFITQALYNNLVRVDTKLTPQPELATDWDVSEDGKVWTFNLRKGVKFHHGREMTSKDVEFTIKRLMDKATASPGRSLFDPVSGIETPDPYQIKFSLSYPYADFPMMFGAVYVRILPFDAEDIQKTPIGTGPFKLKEFVPADRVVSVRNPDYWQKDAAGNQLPYVDELDQVTIPEEAAQIAAISGGSADILMEASATSVPMFKSDPNCEVLEVPSPAYHCITIFVDRPPFQDVRMRQALKYTLDRDQLVKAVLGGYGTASNDNPVSTISPFYVDTGMKKRDIDKAKALMAQAGFQDGVDLELVASNERPGLAELAVATKELAAPAGFRISVKTVPWDVYTAQYSRKQGFNIQTWNGRATIDESLYPYYHSKGSYKELYNFSNPDVDRLLDEGRRETDPAKRKQLYGEVQKILVDQGPDVIPYHRPYMMAINKRVQNFEIHPLRWVDCRWTWLK